MLLTNKDIEEFSEYVALNLRDKYGILKSIGKIDTEDLHLVLDKYINVMNNGYIVLSENGKNIGIHRLIISASKGEIVDHANGIRSDNRRENLRLINRSQNGINRSKQKNNKSGHRGVYWNTHIPTPKWVASIKVNDITKHLGFFNDIDDAIKARLDAEKYYFGDFAPTEERYGVQIYKRTENKYKNELPME